MSAPWVLLALVDPAVVQPLGTKLWKTAQNLKAQVHELGAGLSPAPQVQAFRGYGPRTKRPLPVVWVGQRLWVNGVAIENPMELMNRLREAHQEGVAVLADLVQNILEVYDQVKSQLMELEPKLAARPEVVEATDYIETIVMAIKEGGQ